MYKNEKMDGAGTAEPGFQCKNVESFCRTSKLWLCSIKCQYVKGQNIHKLITTVWEILAKSAMTAVYPCTYCCKMTRIVFYPGTWESEGKLSSQGPPVFQAWPPMRVPESMKQWDCGPSLGPFTGGFVISCFITSVQNLFVYLLELASNNLNV